ncbi:MAG: hypothetical protein EXR76_16840 [Myxococcales bacterium]|nr:hypothetical protein [Myxococcales bacterium]
MTARTCAAACFFWVFSATALAQPPSTSPRYDPAQISGAATLRAEVPDPIALSPSGAPPPEAPRSTPSAAHPTIDPTIQMTTPRTRTPSETPSPPPYSPAEFVALGGSSGPSRWSHLLPFAALGLGLLAMVAQILTLKHRAPTGLPGASKSIATTLGVSLLAALALTGLETPMSGVALGALGVIVGFLLGRSTP